MHPEHQAFLDALHQKRRMRVRFFSRKQGKELVRTCAPLDYGPLRGALDPAPRYQLWDLEGKKKPLNVAVAAEDIREMVPLEETFDPAEIITWAFKPKAWSLPRDWAEFS